MTTPTQAQIEAALYAYGAPNTCKHAMKEALIAAAQVGGKTKTQEAYEAGLEDGRAATIERCAQVAETYQHWSVKITPVQPHMQIAAAIRNLKDEP